MVHLRVGLQDLVNLVALLQTVCLEAVDVAERLPLPVHGDSHQHQEAEDNPRVEAGLALFLGLYCVDFYLANFQIRRDRRLYEKAILLGFLKLKVFELFLVDVWVSSCLEDSRIKSLLHVDVMSRLGSVCFVSLRTRHNIGFLTDRVHVSISHSIVLQIGLMRIHKR